MELRELRDGGRYRLRGVPVVATVATAPGCWNLRNSWGLHVVIDDTGAILRPVAATARKKSTFERTLYSLHELEVA